jgi:hypothetical protein
LVAAEIDVGVPENVPVEESNDIPAGNAEIVNEEIEPPVDETVNPTAPVLTVAVSAPELNVKAGAARGAAVTAGAGAT